VIGGVIVLTTLSTTSQANLDLVVGMHIRSNHLLSHGMYISVPDSGNDAMLRRLVFNILQL